MRGYVADRQEYRKPKRVPRTPSFRLALAGEEWPAPPIRYMRAGRSFADHGEEEGKFADVVPSTGEYIARLRRLYDFRSDAAVEAFLEENPHLVQVLLGAYDRIRKYFGWGTRLVLKVSRDPEAREAGQLFVQIQTKLRPKAARTLLSVLDQEWWHGVYPTTKGNMTIGLEYLK